MGNPYAIGTDGTREEVIRKYREYLVSRIERDDKRVINALRGLREHSSLVCSCAPRPCHGEVVRDIWEKGFRNQPLVYVFGTNQAGRHQEGESAYARKVFAARPGQGEGAQGSAYAIPTRDRNLRPRAIEDIGVSVRRFLEYAKAHPDVEFLITRVGCGLAGYPESIMAPLFRHAPENCTLPGDWGHVPFYRVRLLVAGGRDYDDRRQLGDKLTALTANLPIAQACGISGDARGADTLGAEWADYQGMFVSHYPANWAELKDPRAQIRYCNGKPYNARAGHNRNVAMGVAATHAVLFWDGASVGTAHMKRYLERLNVPMRIIGYPAPKVSPAVKRRAIKARKAHP